MTNKVIAGDYIKKDVCSIFGEVSIILDHKKEIIINKDTVESYEVIDENYKKSVTGVMGRAAVGALIIGPVGLIAGATAKNKGKHIVAIKFKDGKNSLVEVSDKVFKAMIKSCF